MYSILNLEQLITLNGVPNAHGKFYVYKLGRTELADIWYDPNGETILPNPIDLDNLGMGVIYVSNMYDYTVVCCDPYNNELFSRDIYTNSASEGGNTRLYEGLDPIVVNNQLNVISAKKATLSVQDPLYFVEDSQSAVCIGLQESAYSGLPYVENSAIELDASGNISGISGHTFHSKTTESASIVTGGWETLNGKITGYNGSGFSAGKVYNGISPVYVDNTNDRIGVSSKDFQANSPLYFTEYSDRVELSISGLPPTPGLMYESGFNYESGKITGYNNSGISAGKVYSGVAPITVDNVNDTISVASATLGVQAPLFFVEDSESATVIGLNTAQIHTDIPESANWNETYSAVNNNSANWNSAADELAVLNTAKWEEASNVLSSNSADWNNKLDSDIYAQDSGKFLTAVPADYATTAWVTGQGYLTAETDWTNTITAASANAYNQAIAAIPVPFDPTYISAQVDNKLDSSIYATDSAKFLTSLPDSANWDSTYDTVSNNSASWTGGATYEYTDNGLISAIDTSGLFATSALEAESANAVKFNGKIGRNVSWEGGAYFDKAQMWLNPDQTHFAITSGIFSPLTYATGAAITYGSSGSPAPNYGQIYGGFFKGNEWYVSDAYGGQALRGETHRVRGVHISGATTAGYSFNLAISAVSGVDSVGSWKYGHAEDAALRAVSSCDMHESAFGYDANDKISGYNGSAFAGGSDVPEGVMVESALEYNAVNEISGYNGSAIAQYGAEKQWLVHDDTLVHASNSAQYALGVNISAVAQLLGVDETVLWSGDGNTASAFNMSENPFNFQKLKFIPSVNSTATVAQSVEVELTDTDKVALLLQIPRADIWSNIHELYSIDTTGMTLLNCNYTWGAWGSTTSTTTTATLTTRIGTVIGIGRKS